MSEDPGSNGAPGAGVRCTLLRKACVDYNNVVVVFDDEYKRPGGCPTWRVPEYVGRWNTTSRYNFRLEGGDGGSMEGSEGLRLELNVRLATPHEQRPHLKRFYNSAGPDRAALVLSWDAPENFGHSLYAVTNIVRALEGGSGMPRLDEEVHIIPLMADDGRLPSFTKRLLSILPHKVIDSVFEAIAHDRACFDRLSVCQVSSMVLPPGDTIYQVGQRLKAKYLVPAESSGKPTLFSPSSASREEVTRRMTIIDRGGPRGRGREIVNLPELVEFCGQFQFNVSRRLACRV